MSFKNYLKPDIYVTISYLVYDKNFKKCTASIDIWENDTKTELIGSTSICLDGSMQTIQVESISELRKVPPSEVNNENKELIYIIPDDAEGVWKNCKNHLSRFDERSNIWVTWPLEKIQCTVHSLKEDKYYNWTGTEWVEFPDMCSDWRIWDKWMAPKISMAEGTNPTKQMYLFLKTLTKFKNCEDV